jgi:hypothetical protein
VALAPAGHNKGGDMRIYKELFFAEFDKMVRMVGGRGCSISIQRSHYEHNDKIGWLIFVHRVHGDSEMFHNLDDLERYINDIPPITAEREILFRKF